MIPINPNTKVSLKFESEFDCSNFGWFTLENGVDSRYVNWLKERGIERINAASKDYDATVLIFDKMVLSIFQLLTSRFQVFKLVGIRVLMGNWWYQAP